jgi:4-hydroxy-tetrahydrodipicolinate synthase
MGTTGEFTLLSLEERLQGIALAQQVVPEKKRLLVNVGAMTTLDALRLSEAALAGARAADALLCGPPYYHQAALTDERFGDHLWAVAELAQEAGAAVLYYHIPKVSHFMPSMGLLSETISSAPLQGIKDSDGVVDFQRSLRARHPQGDFVHLTGSIPASLESWDAAGDGGIFGSASSMPNECVALWRHWRAGERAEAEELHRRLSAVWKTASSMGIAGARALLGAREKAFAKATGRRPFASVTLDQVEEIRKALADQGFA